MRIHQRVSYCDFPPRERLSHTKHGIQISLSSLSTAFPFIHPRIHLVSLLSSISCQFITQAHPYLSLLIHPSGPGTHPLLPVYLNLYSRPSLVHSLIQFINSYYSRKHAVQDNTINRDCIIMLLCLFLLNPHSLHPPSASLLWFPMSIPPPQCMSSY